MIKKRVLSVSAAVMLGMSTLMAPSAGAQEINAEVTTTVEGEFTPGVVYPGVTWGADGYSVHGSGDRTSGCDLDWEAAAILDSRLDEYQNNGFTLKVEGETGYSALQHFYTPGARLCGARSWPSPPMSRMPPSY